MRTPLRLLALLLALVALAQPAQAQSAQALLERMEAKYASLDALRATFTQTLTSPYAEGPQTSTGSLTLQGDKYRVEAGGQTVVADGETTWIYDSQQNQVLINDFVEDQSTFAPGRFFQDFDRDYQAVGQPRAVTLGGQRHYVLRLKPRDTDGFFREATVWLRDRDNIVTKLEVVDVNDTKMGFQLDNVEWNPRLSGSTFSFRPPRGAEVINLRDS